MFRNISQSEIIPPVVPGPAEELSNEEYSEVAPIVNPTLDDASFPSNCKSQKSEISQLKYDIECYVSFVKDLAPAIPHLVKFIDQANQHLCELESSQDFQDVTFALSQIDEAQAQLAINELFLELTRDGYFANAQAVGMESAILAGFSNLARFQGKIRFSPVDAHQTESSYYSPLGNIIYINQPLPGAKEMLACLATAGQLPEVISTLVHEYTHRQQEGGSVRTKLLQASTSAVIGIGGLSYAFAEAGFLIGISALSALASYAVYEIAKRNKYEQAVDQFRFKVPAEIHSLIMERSAPFFPADSYHTAAIKSYVSKHLLRPLKHGQRIINYPDAKTFVNNAFEVVDAILLLAPCDPKLGRIFFSELPNFDLVEFPKMQEKLESLRCELGLQSESNFRATLICLRMQREISSKLYKLRARNIAQKQILESLV